MTNPRIMFYHDGRHPLIYMYEPPIQKEEYEAGVDELIGTPVDAIMFRLGDGRTFLHDTKAGELWGHSMGKWPHLVFKRAHENARDLIDAGNDPLKIIIDRAHANGLLLYPTLLVQQGSGVRGVDTRTSDYRLDNKHLEIGAKGDLDKDFRGNECLDFMHEEVRRERFSIIEETLTSYDVDGFELQLNYFPYYFRPEQVDEGRDVMTEWIRKIYNAVKESGSSRELAIRVPASVDSCLSLGLDPATWADQGIVDVIIGQTRSSSESMDPTVNLRPLVEAASNTMCRVHASIHSRVGSDRLGQATIEIMRATASNYWAQGIDGLYLAHWFGNWPYDSTFYEKLREIPYPEVMAAKDKSYYVPTEMDRFPIPTDGIDPPSQLPVDLEIGELVNIVLPVSDELARWDISQRVHEVLLRMRITGTTEQDEFSISLNGHILPDSILRKINYLYRMSAPRYRVFGYWYIFRLGSELLPVQGDNVIGMTLSRRDTDVSVPVQLRDVELDVKYLMGKNFYRGPSFNDSDLGPYEHWAE
mgnify:FL=1